jgi:hypothetical protein
VGEFLGDNLKRMINKGNLVGNQILVRNVKKKQIKPQKAVGFFLFQM